MGAEHDLSLGDRDPTSLKWLFLDLNSYFASVEQQERPELRGRPVAVVPMMTDATCAIAASYEAKAYGIKTGTKIYEAKKLCPDLVCVLARHDVYVDYHHRIFDEVENYLPVSKICSIDEAACELLKNEREPQTAVQIAHRIKQGIREKIGEAVTCSVGIAPNRFLAKVASDIQKPDGLVVLDKNSMNDVLYSLNLRDLPGINVNMEKHLHKGRIYSVEQFMGLAPKQARAIWGSIEGERFWYNLHGYDLPERETQKRVVGHSRVLDPHLRSPAKAYAVARRLMVKAAARLRRYDLFAADLSFSARTVSGTKWGGAVRFTPAQDNFTFLNALSDLWEIMSYETRGQNLKKISVSLYNFTRPGEVTGDLFAQQPVTKSENTKNTALSSVIDTLNKRYGVDAVQIGMCPKTRAGHVGTKIAFNRIPEREEFRE